MPSFLLETYVSRSSADGARWAAREVRSAAEALAREGRSIRYVRTTFLPDDETAFHVLDAGSADAVAELSRRAGLGSARIVPVVEPLA